MEYHICQIGARWRVHKLDKTIEPAVEEHPSVPEDGPKHHRRTTQAIILLIYGSTGIHTFRRNAKYVGKNEVRIDHLSPAE